MNSIFLFDIASQRNNWLAMRQETITGNIAHANTPANISDPGDQRVYGPNRLSNVEHPSYQHYVEDLLRVGNSFAIGADPRTCPASSSWQVFGLGKVGYQGVGGAEVDFGGPVPGDNGCPPHQNRSTAP